MLFPRKFFSLTADTARHTPFISTHTIFGHPVSSLHTGLRWRSLQKHGIERGVVAILCEGSHGSYARLYYFVKYHKWTVSSALVSCPSAMTDGDARIVKGHKFCEGEGDERQRMFREA